MPTKVLVSDTNIWIDLHRAGILESVFLLPYEFVVTDFVYRELNEPGAADLMRLGLRVEALEQDGVEALIRLRAELGNPSLADLSCFHLAAVNNWTLLTGDMHYHSSLAGYTPEQVFTGRYSELAGIKQQALDAQYRKHPERFVKARPQAAMPPAVVAINPVPPGDDDNVTSTPVNIPTLPYAQEVARKNTLTVG